MRPHRRRIGSVQGEHRGHELLNAAGTAGGSEAMPDGEAPAPLGGIDRGQLEGLHREADSQAAVQIARSR